MSYQEDAVLIREWSQGDEIVLDNVPLKIERGVGYQLTNVHGRKVQQGEPGPDDHQYNSTNTQRNWLQGSLVRDSQETADVGKYWRGHAWTQTRGQLGHALKVQRLALPDPAPPGPCYPLDQLDGVMYWAVGWRDAHILAMDEVTHTLYYPEDQVKEVNGLVTNVGISYRVSTETPNEPAVWLYIPTTDGYTRLSAATFDVIQVDDGMATVGFAINQGKLYRLTSEGEVFFVIGHDDLWSRVGVLSDGSEAREIYRTYDDDGNRAPGIVSSSGMWLLDHDNGLLWDTDLTFPEHVYQGYGAANWRGDDYLSVGVGIHRKTGTLVVPAGLDEDDGLPAPFAGGLIVHLQPSYNFLVAAIASEPPPEVISYQAPPVVTTEIINAAIDHAPGLPYPIAAAAARSTTTQDPEVFLPDYRIGAIYIWNGLGWTEMHTWNRAPTRCRVTMIRNPTRLDRQQHLFFGDVDGGAWTIHIPSTYYNPLESPSLPLDRRSELEESRIDWNMPDTPKIAKQINVKPKNLWHKLHKEQTTPYLNRIQIVANWIDLDGLEHTSEDPDVLAGPGPYPFSDGEQVLPYLELRAATEQENTRRSAPIGWERYKNTGVLLPTGLPHEAIWMLYRFIGDPASDYTGGVLQWRTIIARKWMRPSRVYSFTVNAQTAHKGMSETDVMRFLDAVCLKHGGVPLVTGDEFIIVDVTRLDGTNDAGMSPRGMRTISCLDFTDYTYELPIGGPSG